MRCNSSGSSVRCESTANAAVEQRRIASTILRLVGLETAPTAVITVKPTLRQGSKKRLLGLSTRSRDSALAHAPQNPSHSSYVAYDRLRLAAGLSDRTARSR